MPSPRWCEAGPAPIAAAIAAAVHHAWNGPEEQQSNRFLEALRQMVGPDVCDRIQDVALDVFVLQRRAPELFETPPEWAWFTICPGCQRLRRTRFTAPQNGRVKLQVLRNPDWLQGQFDKDRMCRMIATRLGCSPTLILDWARKHGILTPRIRDARAFDVEVAQRHREGKAPGQVADELEASVQHVRQSLARQKIANQKHGHHYFEREWWRSRIEERGTTLRAATREAGIVPHEGAYWVKKFGLDHITKARGKKKRPRKYHQLYDAATLRLLIQEHGTYQAVAAAIGCPWPGIVSRQCRALLGFPRRWQPVPHGRREWWVERLAAGKTTWEMAEEAGIQEKTAREKLRLLRLLDRGYRNNYAREKNRRSA